MQCVELLVYLLNDSILDSSISLDSAEPISDQNSVLVIALENESAGIHGSIDMMERTEVATSSSKDAHMQSLTSSADPSLFQLRHSQRQTRRTWDGTDVFEDVL